MSLGPLAVVALGLTWSTQATAQLPDTFRVEGVKVIHDAELDRTTVSVRLHLLGGARLLDPTTAGAEQLLLRASGWGTERFPGRAAREAAADAGAAIWVGRHPDWSTIGFDGLAADFEAGWAVLADRVARPELDSLGIAVERRRMIRELRRVKEDPSLIAAKSAAELAFEHHVYATAVGGTEASLRALTTTDLRGLHAETFHRSRMVLVVVGGVPRERVEKAVARGLSTLPAGPGTPTPPPAPWKTGPTDVRVQSMEITTGHLVGYFPGPPPTHEDYPAFRLAVELLGSTVSTALREFGLTYNSTAAPLNTLGGGGAIYLSSPSPGDAARVARDAIQLLRTEFLEPEHLEATSRFRRHAYWMGNETVSGRADFVSEQYVLHGWLPSVDAYDERWSGVLSGDVYSAAWKWLKDIQWAYVGPEADDDLEELLAEMSGS